ncbi:MAG TPA: DUF2934 domain-containing protein, partial [Bryobacteraceae bacterium]|nr:DUF2934 domain-containing protein [Bryobacteraceae bacterium]
SVSAAGPAPARKKTTRPRAAKPVETTGLADLAAAVAQNPAPAPAPAPEEIANLAYFYWEARGCQGGSPEEDWLRAEQELRARLDAALA